MPNDILGRYGLAPEREFLGDDARADDSGLLLGGRFRPELSGAPAAQALTLSTTGAAGPGGVVHGRTSRRYTAER